MYLRIFFSMLILSGCANSFSRVIDAATDVPEWYTNRRAQILGEGYPSLHDVPELRPLPKAQEMVLLERSVSRDADFFTNEIRAVPSSTTPDDIAYLRGQLLRRVPEDAVTPVTPMSAEEIDALKRLFDPFNN